MVPNISARAPTPKLTLSRYSNCRIAVVWNRASSIRFKDKCAKGASIFDVRSGRGMGSPKIRLKERCCINSVHYKGEGVQKSETFADVTYGSLLTNRFPTWYNHIWSISQQSLPTNVKQQRKPKMSSQTTVYSTPAKRQAERAYYSVDLCGLGNLSSAALEWSWVDCGDIMNIRNLGVIIWVEMSKWEAGMGGDGGLRRRLLFGKFLFCIKMWYSGTCLKRY